LSLACENYITKLELRPICNAVMGAINPSLEVTGNISDDFVLDHPK